MIPGYTLFTMAADLFAKLYPREASVIDGDEPRMIMITEALEAANNYGREDDDLPDEAYAPDDFRDLGGMGAEPR